MPLKTGIKGLESILKGGFPEKSNIVIIGPPGCGKEVIGFQFLFNGLKEGICFYAYYEQTNEEVENNFKNYGMDLKEAINKGKMYWIDAGNLSKAKNVINCDLKSLITVTLAIDQFVNTHGKKEIRALIDLISPALMINEPVMIYRFVSQTVTLFKQHNVTALFLIEEDVHDSKTITAIEALCDGVIEIKTVEKGLKIENLLRIKKMKSLIPSEKYYKFKIGKRGIELQSK